MQPRILTPRSHTTVCKICIAKVSADLNLHLLICVSVIFDPNYSCALYKCPELNVLFVVFEATAFKFWFKKCNSYNENVP